MKANIHPPIMTTKVNCLGCGNSFESTSTVDAITVDVCSQCHPFYTGKQKLIDTAGRVDRFRARSATAKSRRDDLGKKAIKTALRKKAKALKSEPTKSERKPVAKSSPKPQNPPQAKTSEQ